LRGARRPSHPVAGLLRPLRLQQGHPPWNRGGARPGAASQDVMDARTKPNAFEYVTYCYGRRLPASMKQWVADDLAGRGATIRLMVRMVIPAILILAPF